jgi:hypothetical protein
VSESDFKVTCAGCKRSYAWKQERAGKRAKCKCGQIITMPVAPPKSVVAEEPDDLYGLAELAADAQKAPVRQSRIVAAAAAPLGEAAVRPAPLDYRNTKVARDANKREQDSLTDPIRDLYVPAGLIAAGMLSSLIFAFSQTHLGINGIMILSVLVAILTAIKIGALIFAALALAPLIGISFGILSHAILKFTAIIILIDAATLWVDVIFKAKGAISPNGATPILYLLFVHFALAVTLLGGLCAYLFSLDASEVAMLAIPMAILSWIVGLIVTVILFALLAAFAVGIMAAHPQMIPIAIPAPPVASAPIGAAPVGSAAPVAGAPPAAAGAANSADNDIARRIHPPNGRTAVITANLWMQMNHSTTADKQACDFISKMYAAGAVNVYIDDLSDMMARMPRGLKLAKVATAYVELPTDATQIDACRDVAKAYRTQTNQRPISPFDSLMQKYLVVEIKR